MDSSDSNEYESGVLIDQFSSDLNLVVDKECLLAYPISGEGFCSMWAGCRANFGVDKAKVAFEINLEDYCECPDIPKCSETDPNMIRVGWSVIESSMQLGENRYSFAYCNNGKKCTNKIFEDYGETFEKGDSVASYIDFETDPNKILISYSKNGIDMGLAFTIDKQELIESHEKEFINKKALNTDLVRKNEEIDEESNVTSVVFFPHVLTKNIVFEMNFGQRVSLIGDEPFAPIKSDFFLIQKIPIEKRFCSDVSQKNQSETEVIMVVGLPGVGKTEWAENFAKSSQNKLFNVIGISTILEKMKNIGKKPTTAELANMKSIEEKTTSSDESKLDKESKSGDAKASSKSSSSHNSVPKAQMELLDKVLKCMNILIDIASQANRNVIIDQPNIYQSTRRKKLNFFEKYNKRRAVIIIPSNEEYAKRLSLHEQGTNESFINLVNDMKANFVLPKNNELFDTIEYIGLNEEEAEKLAQVYNKEGADNRINLIIDKRNQKKLASKQNVSRVLNHPSPGFHNKFGPRFHPSAPFPQPSMYPNDMGARSRFGAHNNKRFMNNSYYNQHIRMGANRFPPTMINSMIPNYVRPPMFINNAVQPGFQNIRMPPGFVVSPNQQTFGYNLNHSWPAATSTEIWNKANQQQMNVTNSNWDPALPVSQVVQQQQSMMFNNRMPMNLTASNAAFINPNGQVDNKTTVVDAWPAANQPN